MALSIIDVSHLAAAASFYAAITQSLGIRYLSASPARLHFGFVSDLGPQIIFSLQQSLVFPPRPAVVTLLAQSPAAVREFYTQSLRVGEQREGLLEGDDEVRARVRDLDGNLLEAVYVNGNRGLMKMDSPSTATGPNRVLEWQAEVARSATVEEPMPARQRKTEHHTLEQPPKRLVRRETYRRPEGGAVGTLLGAAAVAAVAYALVSSSDKSSRTSPPPPMRRASHDQYSPVVQRIPARSGTERWAGVEEPRYVAQYTVAATPPMGRIEEAAGGRRAGGNSHVSRSSRDGGGVGYEYHLPLRTRSPKSGVGRESGSGNSSYHTGRQQQDSFVTARSQRTERTERTERSGRVKEREREYMAAEAPTRISGGSGSTVRTAPRDEWRVDISPRERTPRSEISQREREYRIPRSELSQRERIPRSELSHRERSEANVPRLVSMLPPMNTVVSPRQRDYRMPRSEISARQIPLPESVFDAESTVGSLAPSDSVSCVGYKHEKEYETQRLRERMRERW